MGHLELLKLFLSQHFSLIIGVAILTIVALGFLIYPQNANNSSTISVAGYRDQAKNLTTTESDLITQVIDSYNALSDGNITSQEALQQMTTSYENIQTINQTWDTIQVPPKYERYNQLQKNATIADLNAAQDLTIVQTGDLSYNYDASRQFQQNEDYKNFAAQEYQTINQ